MLSWKDILIIAITSLGIILPYLIRRRTLKDNRYTHALALMVLMLVATLATYVSYQLSHSDPATTFTRSMLIDGISLYILNYPPTSSR